MIEALILEWVTKLVYVNGLVELATGKTVDRWERPLTFGKTI